MNIEDIEVMIEERLASRKVSVRNRNALKALCSAFSDPVGSLGQIFLGGDEVVAEERHRLQQEAVLELLCKIDDAISDLKQNAERQGFVVAGLIETTASQGESVVGLHIDSNAGPVRLQPGTHIKTSSSGVAHTIGLKIGGK